MSNLGCGYDNKCCNKLILTPSLLMRLFEWCHEDAANDVAMHKVFEKIISFSDGVNPLNIDVYDVLINGANDGQEKDSEENPDEELNYDLSLENGETQVNGQLVDELENAVDSYHEGGISGNDCYNSIQRAFANNVQTEPQISYSDIDTYTTGFGCGETPTVIKLDCVKDVCGDEECDECLPPEIEKQMYEIINLAK